jgi:hypothetical protein
METMHEVHDEDREEEEEDNQLDCEAIAESAPSSSSSSLGGGALADHETELVGSENGPWDGSQPMGVIRYEALIPVSRAPTKGRDVLYFWLFALQIGLCTTIGVFSQNLSEAGSLIVYGEAGSWASTLMIASLLGSCLGVGISIGISVSSVVELILSVSTPASIALSVIVANIFMAIRGEYWYLGALMLLSAVVDFVYYRVSQDNLKVSLAMLDMTIGILQRFGYQYSLGVLAVISAQTFLLLWWGVVFSNVMAHLPAALTYALLPFLAFSLYWAVQVFHAIMATLSSGCVMWYFLKNESEPLASQDRVILYLNIALTSSLGSVCKGALFVPPSQMYVRNHSAKYSTQHTLRRRHYLYILIYCF